jgi:hypothetical protein
MSTRTGAVWIAALALIAGGAASAEPAAAPKWNQPEVLALAEQLAGALRDGEAASREAPLQSTALQQRKRDGAISEFRRVREAADAYVAKLRAGWDRDMTAAHFRTVRNGLRNALSSARDAVPSEQVGQHLDDANRAVAELSRYYPDI